MYLQELSLLNFKNYTRADFKFSPKINCLLGFNGAGKTNLLDAVYYLAFCKSCFNSVDSQNITYTEDFFILQGRYSRMGKFEELYCGFKRNTKKMFKRNKKEYTKLSDHIGLFPLVMISPADPDLVTGGSEERRKFMDGVIAQYDRQYLEDLINYNRALAQRNALLKNFARSNTFDIHTIQIWDEKLVVIGENIYNKRVQFIHQLVPVFQEYYGHVSLGNEKVQLEYQSHLHDASFSTLLQQSLNRDRILQHTSKGIHKDDLLLNIDGFPIKRSGSQGQQKTYLVALKFAQFDFIKKLNGFNPILLLDDVFDKLDGPRVKQIMALVSDNTFGQIFITDTNKDRIDNILGSISADYKLFTIDKGITNQVDYA